MNTDLKERANWYIQEYAQHTPVMVGIRDLQANKERKRKTYSTTAIYVFKEFRYQISLDQTLFMFEMVGPST